MSHYATGPGTVSAKPACPSSNRILNLRHQVNSLKTSFSHSPQRGRYIPARGRGAHPGISRNFPPAPQRGRYIPPNGTPCTTPRLFFGPFCVPLWPSLSTLPQDISYWYRPSLLFPSYSS